MNPSARPVLRAGMRRRRWTAVLAAAMLACTGARAQLTDYDQDEPVSLGQLLPESLISSGEHRVTGVQRVGRHTVAFDIESQAAGNQRVVSIPLAVIRIQEARILSQAIDQYRQDSRQLVKEGRGQISVRGDSLADIVTSPLSTSADVVGQFGRNVGQTLEELGQFPGPQDAAAASSSSTTRASDPILASHRRSIAGQLGLDVHSTNPAVQRFLEAMARERVGGRARAGITTVSISRPPEITVDGGRVQERIRTSVLNEELGALFERDKTLLLEAGVSNELAAGMLGHPVLTPTHKASLTEYVSFMSGVANRGALVEAAMDTQDEPDALGKVQVARMYAWYHESYTPLRELVAAGHVTLAVNRDDALLVALAFDVLSWTRESERVFDALAEFATRKKATGRVVLLTGVLTRRAEEALDARGFQVFERFLFRR